MTTGNARIFVAPAPPSFISCFLFKSIFTMGSFISKTVTPERVYTEDEILSLFGSTFDLPQNNVEEDTGELFDYENPYRAIKGWYLTDGSGLRKLKLPKSIDNLDSVIQADTILHGWLYANDPTTSNNQQQPVFCSIPNLSQIAFDRTREFRGFWIMRPLEDVEAPIYWLQEPDSFYTDAELLPFRAALAVSSNVYDFVMTPHAHLAHKTVTQVHKELPQAFDITLLRAYKIFCASHLAGSVVGYGPSCRFLSSLKNMKDAPYLTRVQLQYMTTEAEKRSNQYPWGEEKGPISDTPICQDGKKVSAGGPTEAEKSDSDSISVDKEPYKVPASYVASDEEGDSDSDSELNQPIAKLKKAATLDTPKKVAKGKMKQSTKKKATKINESKPKSRQDDWESESEEDDHIPRKQATKKRKQQASASPSTATSAAKKTKSHVKSDVSAPSSSLAQKKKAKSMPSPANKKPAVSIADFNASSPAAGSPDHTLVKQSTAKKDKKVKMEYEYTDYSGVNYDQIKKRRRVGNADNTAGGSHKYEPEKAPRSSFAVDSDSTSLQELDLAMAELREFFVSEAIPNNAATETWEQMKRVPLHFLDLAKAKQLLEMAKIWTVPEDLGKCLVLVEAFRQTFQQESQSKAAKSVGGRLFCHFVAHTWTDQTKMLILECLVIHRPIPRNALYLLCSLLTFIGEYTPIKNDGILKSLKEARNVNLKMLLDKLDILAGAVDNEFLSAAYRLARTRVEHAMSISGNPLKISATAKKTLDAPTTGNESGIPDVFSASDNQIVDTPSASDKRETVETGNFHQPKKATPSPRFFLKSFCSKIHHQDTIASHQFEASENEMVPEAEDTGKLMTTMSSTDDCEKETASTATEAATAFDNLPQKGTSKVGGTSDTNISEDRTSNESVNKGAPGVVPDEASTASQQPADSTNDKVAGQDETSTAEQSRENRVPDSKTRERETTTTRSVDESKAADEPSNIDSGPKKIHFVIVSKNLAPDGSALNHSSGYNYGSTKAITSSNNASISAPSKTETSGDTSYASLIQRETKQEGRNSNNSSMTFGRGRPAPAQAWKSRPPFAEPHVFKARNAPGRVAAGRGEGKHAAFPPWNLKRNVNHAPNQSSNQSINNSSRQNSGKQFDRQPQQAPAGTSAKPHDAPRPPAAATLGGANQTTVPPLKAQRGRANPQANNTNGKDNSRSTGGRSFGRGKHAIKPAWMTRNSR